MLHARNLVEDPTFRTNHLDFPFLGKLTPSQHDCIEDMPLPTIRRHHHHAPGPLIVQLAGHDPNLMVRAFDVLLKENCQFAGVDVNLGCPQSIARKGQYGAFLHEENEDLVCDILKRLRQHLPLQYSVSCKIRLPRSLKEQDIMNRIQRLVETGIDFITVHGRTLEENKTKTRGVHVDKISLAVETAGSVPVIANGGIEHYSDVHTILTTTNAAAVMSSEALLETPNLFATDSTQLSPHDVFQQQVGMAREYIDLCTLHPPLPGVLGGFGSYSIVKGHLFKMLHRYLHQHADIRDQLTASTKLVNALNVLDELQSRYGGQDEYDACPSSKKDSSWYRRHWAANRRVHQRRKTQETVNVKSVEER
jgi:tRNA-dihydrouridine synthase